MTKQHELIPFRDFCNGIGRTEAAARGWIRAGRFPLKTLLLDGRRFVIVPGGDVAKWNSERIAAEIDKVTTAA